MLGKRSESWFEASTKIFRIEPSMYKTLAFLCVWCHGFPIQHSRVAAESTSFFLFLFGRCPEGCSVEVCKVFAFFLSVEVRFPLKLYFKGCLGEDGGNLLKRSYKRVPNVNIWRLLTFQQLSLLQTNKTFFKEKELEPLSIFPSSSNFCCKIEFEFIDDTRARLLTVHHLECRTSLKSEPRTWNLCSR